jgi:uncharacterized protein YtpQ (UPF0354 family)
MTRYVSYAVVVLILLSGCGAKQEPRLLTTAEFTDAFLGKLKTADAGLAVTRKGDLALLVGSDRENGYGVFLDNAYNEYRLAPEKLEEVLDRYVQSTLESEHLTTNAEIELDRIVPVIKDAAYPVEVKKSLIEAGYASGDIDFYYETLNEQLLIFYAIDTERNIRYLGRKEVEALKLAPGELRERAVKNLNQLLPDIEKHGDAGTYMVTAGGNYEASLLRLDSIWSTDNFSVEGEIVVTVPSRDLLLVTGSMDSDGLKRLRKVSDKTVQEASYPLTPQLFVRRAGRWMPFEE